MPSPGSGDWAAHARDYKPIEEWHLNILGVNVRADNATVNKAYKTQILQAHPDRNGTTINATTKTQMLNEAKELLFNKEKRTRFEDEFVLKDNMSIADIQKHDIICMHSLATATEKYNCMYGQVVSAYDDPNDDEADVTCDIKTQHSRRQYDVYSAGDDGGVIRVSSGMFAERLRRVYGEPEHQESNKLWSTYYAKDDRVTINNVQEAPWYNGMETTIVGYNYDLMRFDVLLCGQVLAFMPHSISVSKVRVETAEALPNIVTLIIELTIQLTKADNRAHYTAH